MRIGIIAGEVSGDILGAGIIKAIKKIDPGITFEGIAGDLMVKAGCKALFASEKLSVMGIVEVLTQYKELSAIRKSVIRHFLDYPPDIFIGIDAPDFNLGVESALKKAGIPTVHYVSPSVWAWRQYRIGKIARSVDLMLTLFPFEARFYEDHNIAVEYVGHTLADEIPLEVDQEAARENLKLPVDRKIIAVLPGSRNSEVSRLSRPFIETMLGCQQKEPDIHFAIPFVNDKTRDLFLKEMQDYPNRPRVSLFQGRSREVMAACDAVLMASGTATLEAMLLKKPMLVTYKMSPITYLIARHLLKVPYYSLPNLLAGEYLVEELTQNDVNPGELIPRVLALLKDPSWNFKLNIFTDIHHLLRKNADETAARAVLDFVKQRDSA